MTTETVKDQTKYKRCLEQFVILFEYIIIRDSVNSLSLDILVDKPKAVVVEVPKNSIFSLKWWRK